MVNSIINDSLRDDDRQQETVVQAETKPFKLKLNEVSKKPSGIKGEIADIQYWGEFTIVMVSPDSGGGNVPQKGAGNGKVSHSVKNGGRAASVETSGPAVKSGDFSELIVYDAHGDIVEDFNQMNALNIEYDWKRVLKSLESHKLEWVRVGVKRGDILINGDNRKIANEGSYDETELPVHFSRYIKKEKGSGGWRTIANGLTSVDNLKFQVPKLFIAENGRYVIVVDVTDLNKFIVYETRDEHGKILYPRNWHRIDNSFPLELDKNKGEMLGVLDEVRKELKAVSWRQITPTKKVFVAPDWILISEYNEYIAEHDKHNGYVPLHREKITGVSDNICTDNEEKVFFCRTDNPVGIWMIDTSGDPNTWQAKEARFPKKYSKISGLDLDPTGSVFVFSDGEELVLLDRNDLSEIHRIKGLRHVQFLPNGEIRAVDAENNMLVYETNITSFIKQREAAKKIANIDQLTGDLFTAAQGPGVVPVTSSDETTDDFSYLDEKRDMFTQNIIPSITGATSYEEIVKVEHSLQTLQGRLQTADLSEREVKYLLGNILDAFHAKKEEIADMQVDHLIREIETRGDIAKSLDDIVELNMRTDELEGLKNVLVDKDKVRQVSEIITEVRKRTAEKFGQQTEQIKKDINAVVKHAEQELRQIDNKLQFDDWIEYTFPQIKERLARINRECPLEVSEIHEALISARTTLTAIADRYEKKFKEEYARVREEASTKIERTAQLLEGEVTSLLDRARTKQFTSRIQAEEYFEKSKAYEQLVMEIEGLLTRDPSRAEKIQRDLKAKKAVFLNEIERGANLKVKETGQQMVVFGSTEFPIWEPPVKKKEKQQIDLTFIVNERSKGPGVGVGEIMGDIGMRITRPSGKTNALRLFEDRGDESDWRYGNLSYRGEATPPSYLTQKEFRELKKLYVDWNRGEKSKLRQELAELRQAMMDAYKSYKELKAQKKEKNEELDPQDASQYEEAFKAYSEFVEKNKIVLLRQIDRMKKRPVEIETNGKGFVPEWQSHWVLDLQTEAYLEEMADDFDTQAELQEGMLLLKGHAGTGKDVLIKMFCERTRRPYFAVDCTKWTTESELSEDIFLEAEDGASKTVRVPSTVLNAMKTPGAVLYFNEYNAMPNVAQIFLHALMDEKRSLTLKTDSGKTVKALPSLLIVASMNPGYPGTFDLQMATMSRTIGINVDYPAIFREDHPNDPPEYQHIDKPYDASEALRAARSVRSLADFTYEPNMDRNEFVKIWDKEINGIETGAQKLTHRQKFDLETLLAVLQFGHKIRDNFMLKFEKSRESRKALPVTQPFTLREVRRCAIKLNKMSDQECTKTDPEQLARVLIEKYYLVHIHSAQDKRTIKTAMGTWTSQKRLDNTI